LKQLSKKIGGNSIMTRKQNKANHIILFVMIAIFLLVMSYFTIYESTHIIHECSGEECPVCHELHIATTFTKQIISAVIILAECFLFTVFAIKAEAVVSCAISARNLVIDKVRIDD
jgi:hypothetical protein